MVNLRYLYHIKRHICYESDKHELEFLVNYFLDGVTFGMHFTCLDLSHLLLK